MIHPLQRPRCLAVATRDAELLETEFETATGADAEDSASAPAGAFNWPAWSDVPPYNGRALLQGGTGYTCAALNAIPARFVQDEKNLKFVAEFTPTVQNFNIGGYPRIRGCEKARARLDMTHFAAGFVLGVVGGKTADACVANAAGNIGALGLTLKEVMVAPNSAADPADYIVRLNALGAKVSAARAHASSFFHLL